MSTLQLNGNWSCAALADAGCDCVGCRCTGDSTATNILPNTTTVRTDSMSHNRTSSGAAVVILVMSVVLGVGVVLGLGVTMINYIRRLRRTAVHPTTSMD